MNTTNPNFSENITLKNGQNLTLRYPKLGDVECILSYINQLVEEDVQITLNLPFTFEQEVDYICQKVKNIRNGREVSLYAYVQDRCVGGADVRPTCYRENHMGIFGIALATEFRGQGLGKKMADIVLTQAKDILHLKMITLGVYSANPVAIKLYNQLGFTEYGCLPEAIFYQGKWIDKILMYKKI